MLQAAAMAPTIMYENCQFCLKPKRVLAQTECESRQGGRKGNSSTRSHAWENKCFCHVHQMKHMPFYTFWYHFVRNQFFMVLALVALLNFWDRKWQQDEGSGSLPFDQIKFQLWTTAKSIKHKRNEHAFSIRKCLRRTQVLASFPWEGVDAVHVVCMRMVVMRVIYDRLCMRYDGYWILIKHKNINWQLMW